MSTTHTEPTGLTLQVGEHGLLEIERLTSGRGAVTYRLRCAGVVFTAEEPRGMRFEDYYEADTLRLAAGVRDRAERELRAVHRPDLAAIARELKHRGEATATETRRVYGDLLIMGDTAPDERPA